MISGMTFAVLATPDFARTRAFYTETLGLPIDPAGDGPQFAQFATSAGSGFAVLQGEERRIELYLESDDVDADYARWAARGVEMIDQPHDEPFGRLFSFKDPDGRIVFCWKPRG